MFSGMTWSCWYGEFLGMGLSPYWSLLEQLRGCMHFDTSWSQHCDHANLLCYNYIFSPGIAFPLLLTEFSDGNVVLVLS
jgi:hypothetical protein